MGQSLSGSELVNKYNLNYNLNYYNLNYYNLNYSNLNYSNLNYSNLNYYNLKLRVVTMFCPTAVDQFFATKLAKLDLNRNNSSNNSYKKTVGFQERVKEAAEKRRRYPTKIPLIVERSGGEKSLPEMDKIKWIVPHETTLLHFGIALKQRLRCPHQQQFFLLVNGREIPPVLSSIAYLHQQYSDEDGFLYLTYSSQEFYG